MIHIRHIPTPQAPIRLHMSAVWYEHAQFGFRDQIGENGATLVVMVSNMPDLNLSDNVVQR